MADKLQKLFEYRSLLATPGAAELEPVRLRALTDELSAGVPALDSRDPLTSLGQPVRAEIASGGSFRAGLIQNVAADLLQDEKSKMSTG